MRHATILALALLFCAAPSYPQQTGIITTFAGGGPNNLPSLSANLAVPTGLAVDAAGNYYITSITQDRVFKVDSAGILTVFAGNGFAGFSGDGGPATEAMLNNPQGIAMDAAGNVFIADRDNDRIRRVDAATGIITTVAGTGVRSFNGDGIAATSAHLRVPSGVAFDSAGNLYIADQSNQRVRRVSAGPDGVVTGAADEIITTVAGNDRSGFSGDGGAAVLATLRNPTDVSFDPAGNLYICDASNHRIRRVDAGGIITTVAGNGIASFGGDGGAATAASLNVPLGITVAADKLYIADQFNNRARVVDLATDIINTLAGTGASGAAGGFSGDGGPAASAALARPRDVVLDLDGNVLISDANNNRVRRVDSLSGVITSIAGNGAPGFSGHGFPATNASLDFPTGVAVDANGNLFISDEFRPRVVRVDAATDIMTAAAGDGTCGFSGDGSNAANAKLCNPIGMATDRAGNLFIADEGNQRVRRIDSATGVITTVAGTGFSGFGGDGGPATAARLSNPFAVAFDSSGSLFIVDHNNWRIRRVDPGADGWVTGAADEIITTVAGNGIQSVSGDGGPATSASLFGPVGVGFDAANNLYISDANRIRRVEPGSDGKILGAADEIIRTVAGGGLGREDGIPATTASLSFLRGLAVEPSGNLFLADEQTHRIRRVDAASGIITTVAGDGTMGFQGDGGPATAARLTFPTGVALDAFGRVFIADRRNSRIRRVSLNQPPVANAGPDQTLIVGESGTFDGSASSDPDGTIASYEWEFGDGGTAGGVAPTHVYTAAGQFIVTLTVTDDQGATDSDTALITVVAPAQAIDLLADLVTSFNLQQGISNSLDAKLENVRAALDAANANLRQDAANKLQSFINSVEAQRNNELTSAQADQLIAMAQRILGVL